MPFKFNPITGELDLVGEGTSQSPNYSQDFVIGDWIGPVNDHYSIIISAGTHGKGMNPFVQVFEVNGSEFEQVEVAVTHNAITGDVTLGVLATPDARFNGKVIIAENN